MEQWQKDGRKEGIIVDQVKVTYDGSYEAIITAGGRMEGMSVRELLSLFGKQLPNSRKKNNKGKSPGDEVGS